MSSKKTSNTTKAKSKTNTRAKNHNNEQNLPKDNETELEILDDADDTNNENNANIRIHKPSDDRIEIITPNRPYEREYDGYRDYNDREDYYEDDPRNSSPKT